MSEYRSHYEAITNAVWASWPSTTVVASGRWGPSVVGSPCLTGLRCDVWDDHYYRSPDDMAGMGNTYDSYDRSLPNVFVGEYAANVGAAETLQAALAEAIFMIGFERNADVVVQASFAPLFRHVMGTQWSYDLINFNSSKLYGLPSYSVQQLFRAKLGTHTLQTTVSGVTGIATYNSNTGITLLKMVNYGSMKLPVEITMSGGSLPPTAKMTLLTADSQYKANTLDNPTNVAPTVSTIDISLNFSLDLPPWSLVMIEF
eukprot:TRINITY_DN3526_c0_g1_i10.p1 TRINITY_DN3526_c0_g1~~TRINITY_DN3526_c0_g1_i10.p1  ORF type:complete len:297 (-),score=44.16 TRINITY_DN3526_c0_g1_i10:29-802(-)